MASTIWPPMLDSRCDMDGGRHWPPPSPGDAMGADGVFLMTPPNYDPEPSFPQTQANGIAIEKAIVAARPDKVVFLSTVGAQVAEPNLLNNSKMTEETLHRLPVLVAFLRADGLNEGWIDFERAGEQRQGIVTIDTVIAGLSPTRCSRPKSSSKNFSFRSATSSSEDRHA
jgi:uncharacterized protein YbjT (DUF2867 family)